MDGDLFNCEEYLEVYSEAHFTNCTLLEDIGEFKVGTKIAEIRIEYFNSRMFFFDEKDKKIAEFRTRLITGGSNLINDE